MEVGLQYELDDQESTRIGNWINGQECPPESASWLDKYNPHDGRLLCKVAASSAKDTYNARDSCGTGVCAMGRADPGAAWSDPCRYRCRHEESMPRNLPSVSRSKPASRPRTHAAKRRAPFSLAEYFAGEGMRLYGRSLTSGMPGKYSHTVRQPRGVAGLIVPANTPIANIAWKTFPALICGNTVVLKAAEDAPRIALLVAQLTKEAGLPDGVFNVIQGLGQPAGAALVTDPRVAVISFTGSTSVGRWIAEVAGRRLARVSLELGGKNPLVVCDDADLEQAVHWASLSAFSNAGQRCASGSRLIVFKKVYDEFRDRLVARAKALKLGVASGCDLGPVINRRQQQNILAAIATAQAQGGRVLCGGGAPADQELAEDIIFSRPLSRGCRLPPICAVVRFSARSPPCMRLTP